MKKTLCLFPILLVLILLGGCNGNSYQYDESFSITGANIRGGIAVALGNDLSAQNSRSSSSTSRNMTSENIYTIFSNGEYAEALIFNIDQYSDRRPHVKLTAIANGYLYVLLEDYWYGNLGLYAIDLKTEQVYQAKLPRGIEGSFKEWYWDESAVKTKPIVFNKNGVAFFVVSTYSPMGGSSSDRLASWNPRTDSTIQFKTPNIPNNYIQRFQIDSEDRLYNYGEIYNGNNSNRYLQVHDPRSERARYVYFSNDSNSWIRGYATSGSSAVINGYNVLGTNGIVKIDSKLVNGNLQFTSYPLYNNDTQNWFSPQYSEWYDDWAGKAYHSGLFNYSYNLKTNTYGYVWANKYRNPDNSLKTDEILSYISTFYVTDIYIDFTDLDRSFSDVEVYGGNSNNWEWLETHVKLESDPNNSATTFYQWRIDNNLGWLDFSNISDMTILEDGSLWGVINPNYSGSTNPSAILKLLDAEGRRDLRAIATKDVNGNNVRASKIQFNGDSIFYLYPGSEPGTHRLAALDLQGTVKDLTVNVPTIEYMTIFDYTVTPTHVYFSGWDGINSISGKINTATLKYDEITTGLMINSIEALL